MSAFEIASLDYRAATLAIREIGVWIAAAHVAVGVLQAAVVGYGIHAMIRANRDRAAQVKPKPAPPPCASPTNEVGRTVIPGCRGGPRNRNPITRYPASGPSKSPRRVAAQPRRVGRPRNAPRRPLGAPDTPLDTVPLSGRWCDS